MVFDLVYLGSVRSSLPGMPVLLGHQLRLKTQLRRPSCQSQPVSPAPLFLLSSGTVKGNSHVEVSKTVSERVSAKLSYLEHEVRWVLHSLKMDESNSAILSAVTNLSKI